MKKIIVTLLVGWLFNATAYACNYCGSYGQQVAYKHSIVFEDITAMSDEPTSITLMPQSVSVSVDPDMKMTTLTGYLYVDESTPTLMKLMSEGLNIPHVKVISRIVPENGDSWISNTLEFTNVHLQYLSLDYSDGSRPYISFSIQAPEGITKSSVNKTDANGQPTNEFIEYQR